MTISFWLKNLSKTIKSLFITGLFVTVVSAILFFVFPHLSFMFFFLTFCGVCCIIYGLLLHLKHNKNSIISITSNVLRYIALTLIFTFLVSMAFVQSKISNAVNTDNSNCDYIIVLGAGLRGSEPTLALKYRLNKAIEYLNENDNCVAILTGAQGFGEDVTEAFAMKKYITENSDIDQSRLILEENATDTTENIHYSKEIISKLDNINDSKIGVVSNDFHIYRAMIIMNKADIENACPIPAKTPNTPFLAVSLRLREYFSVILEYLNL